MSTGYTKLFQSILASTIWRSDNPTRLVWITMLAMADRLGCVHASIPGLADLARVSLEECEKALLALQSPDRYSRSQELDGRRIMPIDGGWQLVNHEKYRKILSEDERREYLRLKQREYRAKLKQPVNTQSTDVDKVSDLSTLSTKITQALPALDLDPELARSKPFTESTSRPSPPASLRAPRSATVDPPDFVIFWNAYPRRTGKGAALKAWAKHNPTLSAVLKALDWQTRQPAWTKDNGQFIPHPATWLNRQGWEDEPFETPATATRTVTDWTEECAIIHGGTCKSRYFHELMAQPERDVK